MASLKDFLKKTESNENGSALVPSSRKLQSLILNEVNGGSPIKVSIGEAEDFSRRVSELSTSDDVINDLSDRLGAPKDNETEDEFVSRAKAVLTEILKRKLSE